MVLSITNLKRKINIFRKSSKQVRSWFLFDQVSKLIQQNQHSEKYIFITSVYITSKRLVRLKYFNQVIRN